MLNQNLPNLLIQRCAQICDLTICEQMVTCLSGNHVAYLMNFKKYRQKESNHVGFGHQYLVRNLVLSNMLNI